MLTLTLILTTFFVDHSLALNSTAIVSWQLDGNSRSSWDIVWPCLSTIFACTWTVLHLNIPARNVPGAGSTIWRIRHWFFTILLPEVYFWGAAVELLCAILLKRIATEAQRTRDKELEEAKSTQPRLPEHGHDLEHIDQRPESTEWTLRQCFCIGANGLALQTQDEWIYTLRPRDMKRFIQAGIIRCSDFTDRDVKDRAKSDSFAKAFAVFQSAWFLCNIIARWAYHLPVSPIELATVAYVACGILIYVMWWYKPQDINIPIIVYRPFDRENIPIEVRSLMERNSVGWAHLRKRPKEESKVYVLWKVIRTPLPFLSGNSEPTGDADHEGIYATPLENIMWGVICNFAALLYCGIHIAAWNFNFPTRAEQIAWRVFSLASLPLVCAFCIATNVGDYLRFLKSKNVLPSLMAVLNRHRSQWSVLERTTQMVTVCMYTIARFGMMALIFSSLRALPVGSYTTIEWVTSIPHF